MVTLREFLKMTRDEHYRIYQPNRDCLIFESYFKIHSPYTFGKQKGIYELNNDYWDNNDYCDGVKEAFRDPAYDQGTTAFLEEFGNMEVFRVECSAFSPLRMFKDEDGELKIEHVKDSSRPHEDYIPCLNIFIASCDADHSFVNCDRCFHALFKDGERIGDPEDIECKKCPHIKKEKVSL